MKPKAPLRLMKQASPARSCNSTGAVSPHQLLMVALRLKQVDVGNQISSGDTTGIVVITQNTSYRFASLPCLKAISPPLCRRKKAGKPLVVEAWDRTNSKKLSEGTLLSLDNQIDATTGTIKVKARFNNQDDALFPQSVC